jgi:diacylglycerol kinase (ATP)
VVDCFEEWEGNLQVIETEKPGDATRAAADYEGGLILSFGGDGTFNEVLNGADLRRCVLGVIPAGTGNVLAKELGIPWNPERAMGVLAASSPRPIDVGVCNGQRFACICGAGMDASIVRAVHEARDGDLTQLDYIPILMQESFLPTQWGIRVEVDGRCLCEDANIVCVGNSRNYGGPIQVTSAASPVDGQLDVIATRASSVFGMIQPGIAALLRGFHATQSAVYGRGIGISLESSVPDVPVEIDGDFGGTLPAEFVVQSQKAMMLIPPVSRLQSPKRHDLSTVQDG